MPTDAPNDNAIRSALLDMETPLRDALNLSRAMRMASAGIGQNNQDLDGDALFALADQVIAAVEYVDALWVNATAVKEQPQPEQPKPRSRIALVQPNE